MRTGSVWTAVAILLLAGCAQPQAVPEVGSGAPSEAAVRYGIRTSEVHRIPSLVDGASIEIGLVIPEVPDGHLIPIVAVASPYLTVLTPESVASQGALSPTLVARIVPQGYAFASIAVRGTGGSGGCMDLLGPLERADLDQAVTWLGEQPWSNGRVGMIGLSYAGSTPWQVAAAGNPHLRTIVPMEGITDYFQMDYRNGTAGLYGWGFEFGAYQVAVPLTGGPLERPAGLAGGCPTMVQLAAAQPYSAVSGGQDPAGFWAARNLRPLVLENYRGSVLVAHGFNDDDVDPAQVAPFASQLADRGIRVNQVLGQWYHAAPDSERNPNPRSDWMGLVSAWFDHWLRDGPDPGVWALVEDSSGQWRTEEAWPPRDALAHVFELSGDGSLATLGDATAGSVLALPSAPIGGTSAIGGIWNDADQLVCAQCPTFRTEPLQETLRFAGLPTVHVAVTALGPGGYIAAHLFEVDGRGVRTSLGMGGGIDLRYADGTLEMKPVVPGSTLLAKMQLEPMDAVVRQGSRLELVLHQGGFGSHWPPPDTFPVQVELGAQASLLTLHAFERDSLDH